MPANLEQQALSLWLPSSYQDPSQWRLGGGGAGWLNPHSPVKLAWSSVHRLSGSVKEAGPMWLGACTGLHCSTQLGAGSVPSLQLACLVVPSLLEGPFIRHSLTHSRVQGSVAPGTLSPGNLQGLECGQTTWVISDRCGNLVPVLALPGCCFLYY